MKTRLPVLILLLLTACAPVKWPNEKFIKKHGYQVVIGEPTYLSQIEKPDKWGMYPNGDKGIRDLIIKNIKYPEEAENKRISGKVIVKYLVDTDGYVKEIEVTQHVDPLLDAEAVRIIRLMERWIPGIKDGQPVRIEYRQPFSFRLR
jgi:TonB family protein